MGSNPTRSSLYFQGKPMKKTLITKLSLDVTGMSDEQIKAITEFHRVTFMPAGFKDVNFEITQENEEDTLAKWLQRINAEFQANDAPSVRIESNGEILQFPVNDAPAEKNDERPGD